MTHAAPPSTSLKDARAAYVAALQACKHWSTDTGDTPHVLYRLPLGVGKFAGRMEGRRLPDKPITDSGAIRRRPIYGSKKT